MMVEMVGPYLLGLTLNSMMVESVIKEHMNEVIF